MPTWWEEFLHIVTGRVNRHESLPDLRHLPSRRVTVEKTHFVVNDRERRHQDERLYVLRREAGSGRRDTDIAVFSNGRGVGYVPERIAHGMAPLLDELGGAAIVNGAGAQHGSIRLRVDLPTQDALHEYAESYSRAA